ncbi:hypothetical protein GCM10022243_20810 [Saccharothrix violaceirubra]|uniref:Bacterial EndoU nuclease domain-containing protein n=1 Tax=Saccharothrix violaceirubra TaxID=413306 RepID=A0A7W7T9L9_9PSEU|nr:EndoU domain-containing protein [Saccharothrix violaceirubra]MBB4968577.1 hypothetical protein [Saccharothrix violaceirubra]
MALLRDVVDRCRRVIDLGRAVRALLVGVADSSGEVACTLAGVFAGSSRDDVWETVGLFRRSEDEAVALLATLSAAEDAVAATISGLIGFDRGGAPVYDVPTRPPAWTLPTHPLHPGLDEHLFVGHVRGGRLSGYHRHDPTTGTVLSAVLPEDRRGVYAADVDKPVTGGRFVSKARTSLFPATWTKVEIAHAVRTAFANRRPSVPRPGHEVTARWEGHYRGVLIRGYVMSGLDANTAGIDDVTTAWPVHDWREGDDR